MAGKKALYALASDEQADFVNLVRGFGDDQWGVVSLCAEWSVRDVVLHCAIHVHRSTWEAVKGTEKSMQREIEAQRSIDHGALMDRLAAPITAGSLGVQLAELMIHQQDVRRPLGVHRDIPADRIVTVLDSCLSRAGSIGIANARKRARGLRLVATDVDWSWGAGQGVRGPAEAILLAINGRAVVDDLEGDGAETLNAQIA
jgi:uncharacterized protein (TIGR03083 family)